MAKWKKIEGAEKHLDHVFEKFNRKLAPLKVKLEEEVEKLKKAIQEHEETP